LFKHISELETFSRYCSRQKKKGDQNKRSPSIATMNGGSLMYLLAAVYMTYITSEIIQPTQDIAQSAEMKTNRTQGTSHVHLGTSKILEEHGNKATSESAVPMANAQECCKTTQSSDSDTSQPPSISSEGNASFVGESPASAGAKRISGTTSQDALQPSDVKSGNTPTGISLLSQNGGVQYNNIQSHVTTNCDFHKTNNCPVNPILSIHHKKIHHTNSRPGTNNQTRQRNNNIKKHFW
ncbi:hypothetical protein AMECASPLE_028068, partial [Ameca splendens]